MRNKLRLLFCFLLVFTLVPLNFAFATAPPDRNNDGIHIDDIVYYLSQQTEPLLNTEISGFLDLIGPIPSPLPVFIPRPSSSVNVALAANLATVLASTSIGGFPESSVIDGDRRGNGLGHGWGNGGGWNDGTGNAFEDDLVITFNGSKTINEIDVITIQDTYNNPSEPNIEMTFDKISGVGITNYEVQYWEAGEVNAWVTVTNGHVIDNNYVWRQFTFTPVETTKIRLLIHAALGGYSRVIEVEAWTDSVEQ